MLEPAAAWRFAALGGLTAGLALAPLLEGGVRDALEPVAGGLIAACALAIWRPRAGGRGAGLVWLALFGLALAAVGVGIGVARVGAIDAGALDLAPGRAVRVTGHVTAVPRRHDGEVRVSVDSPDGRLLVVAPEPVPDLPVGRTVQATGELRDPAPWEAAWLTRHGIADVLAASTIELRSARRGGLVSLLDDSRTRAEEALGRGTDDDRAALLRGFVLGQDDRIDPETVEEFRRSGLSHLLAVSGQNVLLLALLAWPLLALLGLRLRSRLLVTLILIAVYVPVAGGGASIQRAGVMGAAGVAAALVGRPRSRVYVLLLATAATLALNPRASGDEGWQLSFAAVVGIMLWARPLRAALIGRTGHDAGPGETLGADASARGSSLRVALAEGVAVTVAATLATAPLIASQFEVFSIASLPANLLALPAVAPVMWLGMLAGLAGQLPWLPVEPLTWLAGALAGYVAQVAAWLSAPGWAQVEMTLDGPLALAASYAALLLAVTVALRWARRRTALRWRHAAPALALLALAGSLALARSNTDAGPAAVPPQGLRVTILDVGQGDAILLEPGDGAPILVDAGPADADAATLLADRGVEQLAAVVATHSQADHVGGIPDLLASIPADRLLYAHTDRALVGAASAAGTAPVRIAEGGRLRSGSLRLRVLWPPAELLEEPPEPDADPNAVSLVLLARWHDFEILLTGDAEAELAPVDPGPIDVLKLAHHGSEDAGLQRLLDLTAPRLAVVSVGEDNPYGHPAPAALAGLRADGVEVARTDLAGSLTIDVDRDGFSLTGDD